MDTPTKPRRDHRLAIGFLVGTAVGAGLTLWLAPRAASELRDRATRAGQALRKRTSDRYQDASARVSEAIDELTRKGHAVRDEAADAVAKGAREVERRATAAKSEHMA
jgi:gas vesicle protein